jgi:hypothetical protein
MIKYLMLITMILITGCDSTKVVTKHDTSKKVEQFYFNTLGEYSAMEEVSLGVFKVVDLPRANSTTIMRDVPQDKKEWYEYHSEKVAYKTKYIYFGTDSFYSYMILHIHAKGTLEGGNFQHYVPKQACSNESTHKIK